MGYIQIFVLCLVGSFNFIHVEPLFQGFSIKKEFDVSLKPFEFKPLSFIKEKFSPFGRFGVKHGIQKREVNEEPAPVVEHSLHVEPISVGPFLTPPDKPEKLIGSLDPNITPKPLLIPAPPSPMPPLITPPASSLTSFRPGPSPFIPSHIPIKSSPLPLLVTPVPVFRPISQSTLVSMPYPQGVSAPPLNQIPYFPQNNIPQPTFDQNLAASPVPTGSPFNFLFNTPRPMSMPSLDTNNLSNAGLSGALPPLKVSTPIPNGIQPGVVPDATLSHKIPAFNVFVPPTTTNEINSKTVPDSASSPGLLTDIGRSDLINNYLNTINSQSPKPDVKDIPPLPNNSIASESASNSPLMRGTRLALYFGNIFVQLMSQFFSNARLTLNQLPDLRMSE